MNMRVNAPIVVVTAILMLPMAAVAEMPATTYGWNLGNTLEPGCGEGCWAPPTTQALINAVAANGFNIIRIPVAWDSHADRNSAAVIDPDSVRALTGGVALPPP